MKPKKSDPLEKAMADMLEKVKLDPQGARRPVQFELEAYQWLAIHGMLQLALRHPRVNEMQFAANIARACCGAIEAMGIQTGLLSPDLVEQMQKDQGRFQVGLEL
jgi:hypothetical protein